VLLLLLTWVVYGMVRNHPPSQRIVAACTWLGLALLLAYIGFDRG
jgi:bacteriorhodopsin